MLDRTKKGNFLFLKNTSGKVIFLLFSLEKGRRGTGGSLQRHEGLQHTRQAGHQFDPLSHPLRRTMSRDFIRVPFIL